MEKKLPPTQSTWSADAADLCILLCSFLLSTASIVLIALIFHTQVVQDHQFPLPLSTLSKLQRVITSFCIPVTSAVIMLAGKRYVLLKLTRGGVRSRRFAVYSNLPSRILPVIWCYTARRLPCLVCRPSGGWHWLQVSP